jgi:hypothetical protein
MTVIVLSLAALAVVALVAAVASKWDKKQPNEDPDLRTRSHMTPEQRSAAQSSAAMTAAAMAGMKNRKDH